MSKPVIYVAGHRGLVGSAITRAIEERGTEEWIGRSRAEVDLLDRDAVFDFVTTTKPDAIIVAAAKVGGIKANDTYPVEFLTENLQIQSNLMDAAHAAGIAGDGCGAIAANWLRFVGRRCHGRVVCRLRAKAQSLISPPGCSPGTTFTAGHCPGARRVEGRPIHTASG
jgi:hypothetical protein